MAIRLDDDEPADVQMAPLIDCVFLLIAFFLVATTMRQVRRELPVDLPASAAAQATPHVQSTRVIGIDRQGGLSLDGVPLDGGRLRERLREAVAHDPAIRVRIDGDRAAPLQSAVDALDACRLEGLTSVGIQSRNKP
jgi:biopolymer transport protein ExbD